MSPCSTVSQCEVARQVAHAQWSRCWLFCSNERERRRETRSALVRALERRSEQQHYEARNRAEKQEQDARNARQVALQQQAAATQSHRAKQEHEQNLQLLRLRHERWERRSRERRQRELVYLRALGVEGREARLRRCHRQSGPCEALVLQLISASDDAGQQSGIAKLHERLLGGKFEPLDAVSEGESERTGTADASNSEKEDRLLGIQSALTASGV